MSRGFWMRRACRQKRARLPRLASWLALTYVLWSGAVGADYQAGLDAYQRGDHVTAMAEWRAVVSKPATFDNLAIYRESLYAIGMLHWQGEGVPQDYAVATVWLKQAADINHPGAQVKLGYLYSTGQGVPQNFAEAARYFRLAARQGDADAQHNLAVLQREGLLRRGGESDGAALLPGPEFGPQIGQPIGSEIGPEAEAEFGPSPAIAAASAPVARSGQPINPAPDATPGASDASGSPATAAAPVPSAMPDQYADDAADQAPDASGPPTAAAYVPGADPDRHANPAPANSAARSVAEKASPPTADEAGGREWILAQDPSHYTIQVIALRRPERLNEFAAAHADWAPFAIYPVPGNTLPLWVMVQGVYPDRAAAGEAVWNFPADIQRRDELWVRPFKSVQDSIR